MKNGGQNQSPVKSKLSTPGCCSSFARFGSDFCSGSGFGSFADFCFGSGSYFDFGFGFGFA